MEEEVTDILWVSSLKSITNKFLYYIDFPNIDYSYISLYSPLISIVLKIQSKIDISKIGM